MRIGWAFNFTLAALVVPQIVFAQPESTWPQSIRANGWAIIISTDDVIVLESHAAPGPNRRYPRLWSRIEYRIVQSGDEGSYRSEIELAEYDCAHGSVRNVQQSFYSDNNLVGTHSDLPRETTWYFIRPQSVGTHLLNIACARN
jgi:hypothetical protein